MSPTSKTLVGIIVVIIVVVAGFAAYMMLKQPAKPAKEYIKILGEERTQEIINEYKHLK